MHGHAAPMNVLVSMMLCQEIWICPPKYNHPQAQPERNMVNQADSFFTPSLVSTWEPRMWKGRSAHLCRCQAAVWLCAQTAGRTGRNRTWEQSCWGQWRSCCLPQMSTTHARAPGLPSPQWLLLAEDLCFCKELNWGYEGTGSFSSAKTPQGTSNPGHGHVDLKCLVPFTFPQTMTRYPCL